MSIAVSVLVRPSRCHAFLVMGFAFFFLMTGILVLENCVGSFTFYGKWGLVAVFLSAGILLAFSYFRGRKTLRIDISGNGQIRLKECKGYEYGTSGKSFNTDEDDTLTMAENSTIWPWLVILCLESDSGNTFRVLIFFDSMERDEFRTLYATCRWIDAHGKKMIIR